MELEKEMIELKETLKEHSKLLLKIESVVVDDNTTGRIGYGTRLKNIEKYIESDKKQKWYFAGIVAAMITFFNWLFK